VTCAPSFTSARTFVTVVHSFPSSSFLFLLAERRGLGKETERLANKEESAGVVGGVLVLLFFSWFVSLRLWLTGLVIHRHSLF